MQQIAAEKKIPSYHIDCVERIKSATTIEHRQLNGEIAIAQNWLPNGKIIVGVTSGASTPDKVVEDVIEKIFALKALVPVL